MLQTYLSGLPNVIDEADALGRSLAIEGPPPILPASPSSPLSPDSPVRVGGGSTSAMIPPPLRRIINGLSRSTLLRRASQAN